MSNDTIFYTQIVSIVVFLIALFTLYRLLVDQKDATIQLLKEKTDWLQKQVDLAKQESPDIVLKRLHDRVNIANEEIERLSKEKESWANIDSQVWLYIKALENKITVSELLIKNLEKGVTLHKSEKEETAKLLDERIVLADNHIIELNNIIKDLNIIIQSLFERLEKETKKDSAANPNVDD